MARTARTARRITERVACTGFCAAFRTGTIFFAAAFAGFFAAGRVRLDFFMRE
jgi:hypothetical protein